MMPMVRRWCFSGCRPFGDEKAAVGIVSSAVDGKRAEWAADRVQLKGKGAMMKRQAKLSREQSFSGIPYRITQVIAHLMPDMADGDQLLYGAVSRFARRLDGVSPQRLSGMLERDMPCKADLMEQLRRKFSVNLNWLVTGQGGMFSDEATEELAGELMRVPPVLREHTVAYIRKLASLG